MKQGNKFLFFSLIGILLILILLPYTYSLLDDIEYPISELGNCASENECEAYCENVENLESCLNVAEKYNIMPQDKIEEARKVLPFLLAGETPGGCISKQECETYCDKDENFVECIDFAKKAGFIDEQEYEMIKKTGGKGPGGCKIEECETYLQNNHQ